jgi:hypothetical protein
MERKICVNIFGFLFLLSDYMGTAVLNTDGQSLLVEKRRIARENFTGEICPGPRPCVPVRVRVPRGHGQGHMDVNVDMGRSRHFSTFFPFNIFSRFII